MQQNNSFTDRYDPNCQRCPRLVNFLAEVKQAHPNYFCKPVPPFGDPLASLIIVGLAPGKHGANATGRPFTGDYAGVLLYQTLHRFGLASNAESLSAHDGLELYGCRITNAVKCLPPENKPINSEEKNCNPFLQHELNDSNIKVIIALGLLAHRAVLKTKHKVLSHYPFGHAVCHDLDDVLLIDSYHCSRYNTQTGRLTEAMFAEVFELALKKL